MNVVFEWQDAPTAEFAVIGDPISHSLSPRMHSAAFAALGLADRYVAIHVPRGEVAQALDHLRSLGYLGVNVTVPHKLDALLWAQDREPYAEKAQAANTLRLKDRACRNTDGPGFLSTLESRVAKNSPILMIGAGGSARALAVSLIEAGYSLRLFNRTMPRAEELAKLVGGNIEVIDAIRPEGVGLLLNTTSASLTGDELPIPWHSVEKNALAYDLAYSSTGTTPFLARAKEHGLATLDGRELLVQQGALSFEWWHGQDAPIEAMREALK